MSASLRVPGPAELERLKAILGHSFRNAQLLQQALTHSSALSEFEISNERLEFLGDAIIGALVAEFLFESYPEFQEGRMTRVRSQVVSRRSMAVRARELELQEFLIVGRMFPDPGSITDSILSNALEAIIGAIWIDAGLEAARSFVLRHFESAIQQAGEERGLRDYKSLLGQWAQQHQKENPVYHLLAAAGPDHGRTFESAASLGQRWFRPGFARSKKDSEQRAARVALLELGILPAGGPEEPQV